MAVTHWESKHSYWVTFDEDKRNYRVSGHSYLEDKDALLLGSLNTSPHYKHQLCDRDLEQHQCNMSLSMTLDPTVRGRGTWSVIA